MRSLFNKLIPTALLMAGVALAQPASQSGIFEHVQRDLDRTAANPYLQSGARGHIDHARHELWEFQKKWSNGRFDRGELDSAIKAVNKVMNADSVDYRDRQTLQEDLYRMREYRARRGYARAYR